MRKSISYFVLGAIALFSILGSTNVWVSGFLGLIGAALILKGIQELKKPQELPK